MLDLLVPVGKHATRILLDDRLVELRAGEPAHRVQAVEQHHRGEPDLVAVVGAQQPGAPETGDLPEVAGDLGLVVPLVVVCGGLGCPAAPGSGDHESLKAGSAKRPSGKAPAATSCLASPSARS